MADEDDDQKRSDGPDGGPQGDAGGDKASDDKPGDDKPGDERGDGQDGGEDGDKPQKKKPNPLRNPKVLIIGAVVIAVVALGGLLWWLHARQYVKTDDAFVDTHIVRLAPQVSGQVSRVYVDDNAPVRAGEVLLEIDASAARATYDQAQAQRGEALAKLDQARAQIDVSQAAYNQARDQARGLQAQADAALRDAARLTRLQATTPRAVAQQQVDDAVAQARQISAQRDAALHQAQSAAAQVKAAATGIEGARASLQAAEAAMAENKLTLGHTQVIAPVDGFIAQKTVAPGGYVQPGQELMAVVPRQMWVTANFKETQLKNMRVGQPVDMKVDACPADLHGKIASIQRGSGQAFALLPAENATGNYVKVVQRVPVKIAFANVPKECPLGPGLSVQPRVKVR